MTVKKTIPEDIERLYNNLIELIPEIERKGATMPYTSVNGHMFSFLGKDGQMALRLKKEDLEAFIENFDTNLAISYNTVMKEYTAIPEELLKNPQDLLPYLRLSYAYVKSLKPKPTTRKKKG